ncbi:Rossmann-fold NAD(P)-binding domain-containing protein [Flindersiella endophytica]
MTSDHIALVTGANKGIGRAIVEQLAGLGWTVALAARDNTRGETAVAELRRAGYDVRFVQLDVTDQVSVAAAAGWAKEEFGRLDALVNNAGVSGALAAQVPSTADVDAVREVFETNVFGVLRVTNAMLPLLRESPAPRVVNVSSSVGSLARMTDPGHYFAKLPGSAAYAPSKTALNSLTVQYAKELKGSGILVNAADPGPCATDFTRHIPRDIPRTAADGAVVAVRLATLGADGPTGGFFNQDVQVPW